MSIFSLFPPDQFPVFAVWIIGLILSFVFWRRHPKVSLLTLIAITGFLTISLANNYLTLRIRTLDLKGIQTLIMLKSLVSALASAVFWALLGVAVFSWRSKQEISEEEAAVAKKDSKIHRAGMVSLILSAINILILLGTLFILIRIGSAAASSGTMDRFWTGLFGTMADTYFVPLWALPLGVLDIIMGIIARKNDGAAQNKIASLGITVGTVAVIISLWLSIYLFIFIITAR